MGAISWQPGLASGTPLVSFGVHASPSFTLGDPVSMRSAADEPEPLWLLMPPERERRSWMSASSTWLSTSVPVSWLTCERLVSIQLVLDGGVGATTRTAPLITG